MVRFVDIVLVMVRFVDIVLVMVRFLDIVLVMVRFLDIVLVMVRFLDIVLVMVRFLVSCTSLWLMLYQYLPLALKYLTIICSDVLLKVNTCTGI